ncbi:putative C6 transcription factor (AmyR) [Aspergillus neoniger CBS 115656]|uniref:Amylase cluster transcriptional regulator AmyR n=1 Tax=Aspergillus neoniger (strain CBS 115656) TaxID=1448310 RepID=A0A318YIY5_ASPNB|nr:amylase cluster transcriptional regulator AmyR [Aspergillus neoniger CBS 115656]PYH34501.1 amylase cluster transcriptional regulator AmyR [Aspergillus neoniger CBS 115656]
MDSHPSPTKQKASKQACDNCRRRKIKCSRELPCDKCRRLLLSCSYSDVLRRKGPKFRTLYPLAPIHPLVSRQQNSYQHNPSHNPLNKQWTTDGVGYPLSSPMSPSFTVADPQYLPHDAPEPFSQLPPPELVSSPDSTNSLSDSSMALVRPYARRLSAPVLLAHVNVYLKYLFPIMPVVRKEELQQDCHQPERLSPQRYVFLVALCAATHIQLKLDGTASVPEPSHLQAGIDGHSWMSGEELLAEAVRARKDCDPVDGMNIESLLTSFFLFASYGNLDRQDHAWFYLCQATSMVFTLALHRESSYVDLSIEEAEERRRVFWLLFVTERGYALQQAKPVMLRNSIRKPQVLCSEDPILAYGFINLISIFEKLTVNLYDWVSAGGMDGSSEMPPTSAIQSSLCNAISVDGVSEIQKVDILITQQWLQTVMWKLSMTRATQPGSRDEAVLPFHLPVLVGKAVMNVIGAASQGAVDAHGIGMEQKLFDLGSSVADVARSLNTKAAHRLTEAAVDPRELLWGILTTLSRIRGSQSYLFPSLLERCKGAMDFTSPTSMGNFLPPLSTAPTWEEETGLAVVTVPENPDSHEPETALMEPLSQLLPTPQVQFPENNLLN